VDLAAEAAEGRAAAAATKATKATRILVIRPNVFDPSDQVKIRE
jgi:hypothetical protein